MTDDIWQFWYGDMGVKNLPTWIFENPIYNWSGHCYAHGESGVQLYISNAWCLKTPLESGMNYYLHPIPIRDILGSCAISEQMLVIKSFDLQ